MPEEKLEWKPLVMMFWEKGLKSALEEFSKRTDNKWDDMAIEMLDGLLKKIL